MPRRPRVCPAGTCFHVFNRAVARLPLFEKAEDYAAFERVLAESFERERLPIYSYCVMPNHWHFVVRPKTTHQVTRFFRWLANTHTMRWHAHHHTQGTGHQYQGRFKAFPIEQDDYLLQVLRYVERNALRANLCERAEDWRWCSLWRGRHSSQFDSTILGPWPIERPRQWLAFVNKSQNQREVDAIRHCLKRGTRYGSENWVSQAAVRLQLSHTLRPRGRPRKQI